MIKYVVAAAALVLAVVPAAFGMVGNDSFTRDVPIRIPDQARTAAPTPSGTGHGEGSNGAGHGPDRGSGHRPQTGAGSSSDDG